MTYSFQFHDVLAAREFLLDGLILALELSLFTMAMGLLIGVSAKSRMPELETFLSAVLH